MQLIYRTNSIARADELCALLERNGIAATVHGAGTYTLVRNRAPDAVSVWVVKDEDLPRASAVLQARFGQEAANAGVAYPPKPLNPRLRAALLATGAFVTLLLALLAAYGA